MPVELPLQRATPKMRVLGRLASGGMGTVWLAEIEGADRRWVALKRLHDHLGKEARFVEMFLDEIWLTSAIGHDNVVAVVGWGVDDKGPYLATELVNGLSLWELAAACRAAGEPLPEDLVAFVAAGVAEGLHAAHSLARDDGSALAVVHRDLTPSNVLVDVQGRVKITDFGIATAAHKLGKTRTGVLKGKAQYMSPEYVRGESLDGRSDLFSLGVVMFEVLAGRRPFPDIGDYALLQTIAREQAPSILEVADVDGELGAIVDRLLARDRDARYASGAEVTEALGAWLERRGRSTLSCREELGERVRRHGAAALGRVAAMRSGGEALIEIVTAEHTPHTRRVAAARPSAASPPAAPLAEAPSRPGTRVVRAPSPAGVPPAPKEEPPRTGWASHVVVAAVAALVGAGAVAIATARDDPGASAEGDVGSSPPPQVEPGAGATAEPTAAASIEPPPPEPTASAAVEAPPPATVAPAGTPPRPTRSTPPATPSATARSCTPLDFDYPHCDG